MKLVTDLHMHSHYSRATSKNLNLEQLYITAQQKGVGLIGTGDFTHPLWIKELQEKLIPCQEEDGLYELAPEIRKALDPEIFPACQAKVRFLLSVEISNIYRQDEKVRKVHNLVFVPSFKAAKALNQQLAKIGNLSADGRPILGLSSRNLLEYTLESDSLAFLIPAHVWTPHFAVFGSISGFDRLEDCYQDLTSHIFALETGLSSDPGMNYRISQLDQYTMMSSSDAHSPAKLAREATIVNIDPSFLGLRQALEQADPKKLLGTIEFFPEEGKYHLDGHRDCQIRLTPQERKKLNGTCPVCGKAVTVGVLSRIEALADRSQHSVKLPPRARPFVHLVPLTEILSETLGVGEKTKQVSQLYPQLLEKLGNELYILQEASLEDIKKIGGSLVAEAISRVRKEELYVEPGYDGEYGTVKIFRPEEREPKQTKQGVLFKDK